MIHASIANLLKIDPKAGSKDFRSPSRSESKATPDKAEQTTTSPRAKTYSRQFIEHFSHPKF